MPPTLVPFHWHRVHWVDSSGDVTENRYLLLTKVSSIFSSHYLYGHLYDSCISSYIFLNLQDVSSRNCYQDVVL